MIVVIAVLVALCVAMPLILRLLAFMFRSPVRFIATWAVLTAVVFALRSLPAHHAH